MNVDQGNWHLTHVHEKNKPGLAHPPLQSLWKAHKQKSRYSGEMGRERMLIQTKSVVGEKKEKDAVSARALGKGSKKGECFGESPAPSEFPGS